MVCTIRRRAFGLSQKHSIRVAGTGGRISVINPGETVTCPQVVNVHTGDTIEVRHPAGGTFPVRLFAIEAPRISEPFGRAARQELARLLGAGPCVIKVVDIDHYGHAISIVSVDTLNQPVNVEMVASGFARALDTLGTLGTLVGMPEAMIQAQVQRLGMWSPDAPDVEDFTTDDNDWDTFPADEDDYALDEPDGQPALTDTERRAAEVRTAVPIVALVALVGFTGWSVYSDAWQMWPLVRAMIHEGAKLNAIGSSGGFISLSATYALLGLAAMPVVTTAYLFTMLALEKFNSDAANRLQGIARTLFIPGLVGSLAALMLAFAFAAISLANPYKPPSLVSSDFLPELRTYMYEMANVAADLGHFQAPHPPPSKPWVVIFAAGAYCALVSTVSLTLALIDQRALRGIPYLVVNYISWLIGLPLAFVYRVLSSRHLHRFILVILVLTVGGWVVFWLLPIFMRWASQ